MRDMSWFLLALVGPFLYAVTNHIDKLLLRRYFREGGVGTLLILSALLSALALPFLYAIDPTPFSVSGRHVAALAGVGFLNVLVLWFYLTALQEEDASVAIVFYQLVPAFGYGFGFAFLGETLSPLQLCAMAVIIAGTALISFEMDAHRRLSLRTRTISFMTAAALCWALESVIFKVVALEERVVRSLFWEHLILAFCGLCLFVLVPRHRHHFVIALRANSRAVLWLNVLNEALYMLGNIAFSFAYMLAPVALVLLAESYQPLFVLAIGVALALFWPSIASERIGKGHLVQRGAAAAITGIGTYLLVRAGHS